MIRVLLCAEKRADKALTEGFLREVSRRYVVDWAPSYADAWSRLREGECHVTLVDSDIGMGRGLELLHTMVSAGIDIPFVLLVHESNPNLEAAAIRAGASAVLVRDEVTPKLLERTVRHAAERARVKSPGGFGIDAHTIVTTTTILDRVELALIRARRGHRGFAVLAISYDMPGSARQEAEAMGALFFGTLSERIRQNLGDEDSIFRVGKHDFVVLLESLFDSRAAAEVAGRILSALAEPISIHGREVQLAAQIGVSVYPEHGAKPEALLQLAREAMHSARAGTRSQLRVHSSVRPGKANRRGDLRRAIVGADERGELVLYYQPQVNLVDGLVVGAEALMRWISPEFGLVPPIEFIPIAEEAGLIADFGAWALREGCRQAKEWHDAGQGIRVGVNVSAQQFADGRLGEVVQAALASSGLPASLLELEITEGLLLENTDETRSLLSAFRKEGVLIAVDDFGTGYASLAYVKRFPMDVIKIDREFVRNLPLDTENAAITSAIVALARSLGLEVIAEGVENEAEEEFLRALHCHVVQGYLHAKPMPAADFDAWREKRRVSGVEFSSAGDSGLIRRARL